MSINFYNRYTFMREIKTIIAAYVMKIELSWTRFSF